jgi:hypothetical protein
MAAVGRPVLQSQKTRYLSREKSRSLDRIFNFDIFRY